jgi:hypothetical protein
MANKEIVGIRYMGYYPKTGLSTGKKLPTLRTYKIPRWAI